MEVHAGALDHGPTVPSPQNAIVTEHVDKGLRTVLTKRGRRSVAATPCSPRPPVRGIASCALALVLDSFDDFHLELAFFVGEGRAVGRGVHVVWL